MTRPARKTVKLKPNDRCFCGSDLKFKKCCSRRLPGSKSIGDLFVRHRDADQYEMALLAARADITQYTIWHQNHTATGLFEHTPISIERMWHVDVEALFHYVQRLYATYVRLDRAEEFPAVIERLRDNICSDQWRQKIILLHTCCALGREWNEEAGYREIQKAGDIKNIADPDLLAMYLNLSRKNLSLSDRIKLIDRVRSTSENDSDIVHQGLTKAILLFEHNDRVGARQTLDEVISYCEKIDDLDPYQRLKYGQALFMLAAIQLGSDGVDGAKSVHLEQAIAQFDEYLQLEWLNEQGRAEGLRDLADACRLKRDWQLALEKYREANELNEDPVLGIFCAVCLKDLDKLDAALAEIDKLSIDSFTGEEEKADYVLHFAEIAIADGKKDRLEIAKRLLNTPIQRAPIFHQQALSMLKLVYEAIESGRSSSLIEKSRKLLSAFSSSIMLQPNIMGIGLNFNKLIDDALAKQPKALDRLSGIENE